ncbi:nephrin-like isoform X2 [Argiope bruennichi]|uniref:nephrin-like isoform X2 n=1 Tax=Argiope bruennichi TaxID=94029 RepID=UPI00249436FA|nr:nephrin-like isoform X2 [Argiope bruennichi]
MIFFFKMKRAFSWKCILIIAVCCAGVKGQQQYFRVKPQNTAVVEGQTVELQCRIGNQAGSVQWSKDGFVLGFDRMIPGYPRYFMEGSGEDGVHDLRIENAQLEDDGEFQCQVGPSGSNKAIRADVNLTVLMPPSSISISQHPNGSIVEVMEGDTLTLKCVVAGGKPAAGIRWHRKGVELRPDNVQYNTEKVDEHRETAISTITLTPTHDDNRALYSCEAGHKALSTPMISYIELSVLFPPGPPEIEGYQEGETVRMGDTLTLACVSRGGNPLAKLVWFRNDQQVDVTYTTTGRESTNTLTFQVESSDNNAIYRCEATNSVSPKPMVAMVKLTVQFAPSKVTIMGPKEAQEGDAVTMVCMTDRSNPPADVSWVVDGRPVQAASSSVADPRGGWVTTSNVTVTITGHERNMKMFSCYAVNQALSETMVETAVVSVLYPPKPPTILGYTEGTPIETGSTQQMSCVSQGGNPLPTLKWFKKDKEIESTTTTNNNVVTAEVSITVDDNDNGVEFRCEASNSASLLPMVATTRLTVYFPPSAVNIKVKPQRPKAGQKVTLICECASSNPQADITWWKDGFLIHGTPDGIFDAPNGGRSTKNILQLNVTSQDDGAVYTCQATNPELKQSAHDAVTINVLYKPEFETKPLQQYDVIEGESTTINITAKGNPSNINYSWSKASSSTSLMPADSNDVAVTPVLSAGSLFNVTNVRRDQAGQYRLEASNEEGSSFVTVVLNVLYGASISMATEYALVDQGSNAFLECQVDANPLSDDVIRWQRPNFDMSRTRQSIENGRSYLIINNVTREDSGIFLCVADNGIGNEAQKASTLVVKHKPVIERTGPHSKAAGSEGEEVRIICRATGAPNVSFTWFRDGSTIQSSKKVSKYEIKSKHLDFITYESTLTVKDLKTQDYGDYECIAKNDLGFESFKVPLGRKSAPDPPISLNVLNATHNAVILTWTPGFDGGIEQMYRIQYRKAGSTGGYTVVDVDGQNTTVFTVGGLELGTEYVFGIMALNNLGGSDYLQDAASAVTLSKPPLGETEKVVDQSLTPKGDIPRIIIITVSVVGSCLLVLNIVLVVCFVRKRRKKRLEEGRASGDEDQDLCLFSMVLQRLAKICQKSDHSSSKAATIEMYAPSSYNEGLNGESLSCNSEKSDNYSDGHSAGGYSEEQVKSETTAYITAHSDGAYIPDSSMPYYCPYPYPDQVNLDDRYDRSGPVPNKLLYGTEEDFYTNALRRNAYNLKLGDRPDTYEKGVYPPPPPGRTAASGAEVHQPPSSEERHYVPYPSGATTSKPSPALSTFNPHLQGSPLHSTPNQCNHMPPAEGVIVHSEMDGHLV